MKRLLLRLKSLNRKTKVIHLKRSHVLIVEANLKAITCCVPEEFPRKFESGFLHIKLWKATEFRLFLLYVGIAFFLDSSVFSTAQFNNFKYLCCSMRLLVMKDSDVTVAARIILKFLNSSIKLYGPGIMSYSYHNLIHLPDDYRLYGNLDEISAFPFESFLGNHVKKAVRAPNKAPQQIAQHLLALNKNMSEAKGPAELDLTLNKKLGKYKGLKASATISANNCVLLKDGGIAYITEFQIQEKEIYASCKKFKHLMSLFLKPIDSKSVLIFKIPDPDQYDEVTVHSKEIDRKMMLLPCRNFRIAVGLLHSLD